VRTREVVRDALPDGVLETVDGTDIGYGWTRGYTGLICVISVYSRWVNLGIADAADLGRPGLRELLTAASAARSQPR
jgi:hypothetical protein